MSYKTIMLPKPPRDFYEAHRIAYRHANKIGLQRPLFLNRGRLLVLLCDRPYYSDGTPINFQLIASPAITVAGKRHCIARHAMMNGDDPIAALRNWINRSIVGGTVNRCSIDSIERLTAKGRNSRRIVLTSVWFSGEVHIVDGRMFSNTVAAGIGKAKGFGFGLILDTEMCHELRTEKHYQ